MGLQLNIFLQNLAANFGTVLSLIWLAFLIPAEKGYLIEGIEEQTKET